MAFTYQPRISDSNFAPIRIQINREGVAMEPLGVEVFVNVRSRDTREMVVIDGVATPVTDIPGRWEYRFSSAEVAQIRSNDIWLIEWSVKLGGNIYRTPDPAEMNVRKRLQ